MSTHNLCFGSKIRKKNVYPSIPQFCYIKVGYKGVYITLKCYPDELPFSHKTSNYMYMYSHQVSVNR